MNKLFKEIDQINGKISHNECFFLYKLTEKTVRQFGEKSILCEIGSYHGKSTVSIATALKEENSGMLYAVDCHKRSSEFLRCKEGQSQSSLDKFMENLKSFSVTDRVVAIEDLSQNSFDKVPDEIHFLWIDGSHDYKDVKSDYENFHKKLANGGYLLFHDACWTSWTDPFKVISELILDNENYNLYALMGNTIVFKKETNRTWKIGRFTLRCLCRFVSGEKRAFYKRIINALLLRITSFYALYIVKQ